MQVHVRQATEDDASAMGKAHARAWQVAYRGMVPDDYLDAIDLDEWSQRWLAIMRGELFVEGIPRPADYVATVDGAVVGFANVGRFRDDPDNTRLGELWSMYVHPDSWGTGAGYALMNQTFADLTAARCQTSYLWVLDANDRARRFYERQGWTSDDVFRSEEIRGVTVPEVRYSIKHA